MLPLSSAVTCHGWGAALGSLSKLPSSCETSNVTVSPGKKPMPASLTGSPGGESDRSLVRVACGNAAEVNRITRAATDKRVMQMRLQVIMIGSLYMHEG